MVTVSEKTFYHGHDCCEPEAAKLRKSVLLDSFMFTGNPDDWFHVATCILNILFGTF